ncbi:MAG: hypothetical protein K8T91_22905 [Planctomycetes bacterium]|nr:hypothetical protein [Planctomycetota bacterium]
MPTPHENLIRQIHASGTQSVLCLTGGGSSVVGELLEIPGGSGSLLEAVVPYCSAALDAFLGGRPENYCSQRTARGMAMGAFQRGREYLGAVGNLERTPGDSPGAKTAGSALLAGIGCTASLASDRPKRGAHRAHVAVQTLAFSFSISLELTKEARSRRDEERLVAAVVLNAVAEACGLAERVPLELLPGETPICQRIDAPAAWQELLWGQRRAVCHSGSSAPPAILFPGSYHPRHEAHRQMAQLASQRLGQPVAYEISVENVDKPLLDYGAIAERAQEFTAETLWLTRAPTFVEKAELFPGVTFVVGVDTIRRIAEPKYYGGNASARDEAIARLTEQGCQFLVFGRVDQGQFQTLDDVALPLTLKAICQSVPPEQFRSDVSSTQLRRAE